MPVVMFYHLTRSGVAQTAATLLERALGAGWRVMVRGTDLARLEVLDTQLWLPEDSFLPHALAGGPMDSAQPVLLGLGPVGNDARALMVVDGAAVEVAEASGLERVWILFDGNDEGALVQARGQWKHLSGAGLSAQYWAEDSGRWQKKSG